jgi:hypothetical protein
MNGVEVTAVSLSARDRQALTCIEARLASSDPKLAWMLNAFTRLTAGEDMPAPERTSRLARAFRLGRVPALPRRRPRSRPRWQRPCLLLWLATSLALITTAVVLAQANAGTCSWPAPAACVQHATRPPGHHLDGAPEFTTHAAITTAAGLAGG